MPERKPARKDTRKPVAKRGGGNASAGFTQEERAAMRERVNELKASARADKPDGESELLAKLAAMAAPDRALGERIHAIVKANAPDLISKLWYGMPAYANKAGQVVCFFRDARKFKTRYATFGFSDKAHLDQGGMWPTDFALKEITPTEEARIVALVKKAVS